MSFVDVPLFPEFDGVVIPPAAAPAAARAPVPVRSAPRREDVPLFEFALELPSEADAEWALQITL